MVEHCTIFFDWIVEDPTRSKSWQWFHLYSRILVLAIVLGLVPQLRSEDNTDNGNSFGSAEDAELIAGIAIIERASLLSARQSTIPFANPPEIHSGGGILSCTLTVCYSNNFLGGDPVYLRSYNGHLVGPTLRVIPGDKLKVRLVNELPDEPTLPGHTSINVPHGLNTTNLHTHGLHVSPEDASDNVFLEVDPHSQQDYRIQIDGTHPPGTHWYHPHKHGSVAIQVSSGMAGALIVEGGLDEVPEIKAARERIFVFQQIPYTDITLSDPVGLLEGQHFDSRIVGWSGLADRLTTINGLKQPVIEMFPGEVERWRFVHAGIAERLDIAVQKADSKDYLSLHEIAADGIALGTRVANDFIPLAPGYRSDVLVQAPSIPGVYYLMDLRTSANRPALRKGGIEPERALAKIVVQGMEHAMSLPSAASLSALAPYADISATQTSRRLVFNGAGSTWTINGQQLNPEDTSICPVVGTSEEWTLFSQSDHHPFHIHVNPFQVISNKDSLGNETLQRPVWKDTIFINEEHTITFRTMFDKFLGKSVLHCHKLDHEDQGMMQVFRIIPDSDSPFKREKQQAAEIVKAPYWELPDALGGIRRLTDYSGKRLILVFHRGLDCVHCAEQLQMLAREKARIDEVDFEVVAIGSVSPTQLRKALTDYGQENKLPFLVLADAKYDSFRQYDCFNKEPLHGVFVIDEQQQICWHSVGNAPFMDINKLLDIARSLPKKR